MNLKYTMAALVVTTCTSQAALILTGGNFEDGLTGDTFNVANFFESSIATSNYQDYITDTNTHFSTNKTRKLALTANGYVYQSLGLYTNEASITISGNSLIRDSIGRNATSVRGARIDVYQAPATSTGVDGTPVNLIAGASYLGGYTLNARPLSYTGDTASFMTDAIDISGATAGNNIWLTINYQNISGTGNFNEVVLDNLNITTVQNVTVPEPSSVALLGLGGLALILRRRK